MKILAILAAAGLVAGTAVLPAAEASAQRTVVTERTVVRHDGGRHYRPHTRKVCRTVWRNHHKVRRCYTVRR